MLASRRRFLSFALPTLIAAPAIVRVAANLMPVSSRVIHLATPDHYEFVFRTSIPSGAWRLFNMEKATAKYAELSNFPADFLLPAAA